MIVMQCAVCGKSVFVDQALGDGQPCPNCGAPVGSLPADAPGESTALDELGEGEKPIRFGAYGKAADAAWDDPMEPRVEEQVARIVADEALIDNAVINEVPPEVQARYRARRRENMKKLIGMGIVAALILAGLIAFILY